MTKITWAAASAIAALAAACTTEVVSGTNDGGTATSGGSGSGSGGAAGSSTTSTTSTTTGSSGGAGTTGGSGGSSSTDGGGGGVCTAKTNDSACRTCALAMCHDETCGCESNTACAENVDDFYTCLSSAAGTLADCATTFSTNANAIDGSIVDGGASWSNELSTCMMDCEDRCKGRDAGPKR